MFWLRWTLIAVTRQLHKNFRLNLKHFHSQISSGKILFLLSEVRSWCLAKNELRFIQKFFSTSLWAHVGLFLMIYRLLFQIFKVTVLKDSKRSRKKIESCFFIAQICDSILLDHFLQGGNAEWEDKNAKVEWSDKGKMPRTENFTLDKQKQEKANKTFRKGETFVLWKIPLLSWAFSSSKTFLIAAF